MDTCELCAYSDRPPYKSPCYECFDFDKWEEKEKSKTNADHIRSMSDEELAMFLETFGCCHYCTEHHRLGDVRFYSDEKCDEQCELHMLEWLKQPYKEE